MVDIGSAAFRITAVNIKVIRPYTGGSSVRGYQGLIRRRREIDGQTELIMRKSIKRREQV